MVGLWKWVFVPQITFLDCIYTLLTGLVHKYFPREKKLNSFKINTLLLKNKIFTLKYLKVEKHSTKYFD